MATFFERMMRGLVGDPASVRATRVLEAAAAANGGMRADVATLPPAVGRFNPDPVFSVAEDPAERLRRIANADASLQGVVRSARDGDSAPVPVTTTLHGRIPRHASVAADRLLEQVLQDPLFSTPLRLRQGDAEPELVNETLGRLQDTPFSRQLLENVLQRISERNLAAGGAPRSVEPEVDFDSLRRQVAAELSVLNYNTIRSLVNAGNVQFPEGFPRNPTPIVTLDEAVDRAAPAEVQYGVSVQESPIFHAESQLDPLTGRPLADDAGRELAQTEESLASAPAYPRAPSKAFASQRIRTIQDGKPIDVLVDDTDKELTQLVRRRKGGDGNRSDEVRLYVLDRGDGTFQVINPDGSPNLIYGRGALGRLMEEQGLSYAGGPQLPAMAQSISPEIAGSRVLQYSRSGDGDSILTSNLESAVNDVELLRADGNGDPFRLAMVAAAGGNVGDAALALARYRHAKRAEAMLEFVSSPQGESLLSTPSGQQSAALQLASRPEFAGMLPEDIEYQLRGMSLEELAAEARILPHEQALLDRYTADFDRGMEAYERARSLVPEHGGTTNAQVGMDLSVNPYADPKLLAERASVAEELASLESTVARGNDGEGTTSYALSTSSPPFMRKDFFASINPAALKPEVPSAERMADVAAASARMDELRARLKELDSQLSSTSAPPAEVVGAPNVRKPFSWRPEQLYPGPGTSVGLPQNVGAGVVGFSGLDLSMPGGGVIDTTAYSSDMPDPLDILRANDQPAAPTPDLGRLDRLRTARDTPVGMSFTITPDGQTLLQAQAESGPLADLIRRGQQAQATQGTMRIDAAPPGGDRSNSSQVTVLGRGRERFGGVNVAKPDLPVGEAIPVGGGSEVIVPEVSSVESMQQRAGDLNRLARETMEQVGGERSALADLEDRVKAYEQALAFQQQVDDYILQDPEAALTRGGGQEAITAEVARKAGLAYWTIKHATSDPLVWAADRSRRVIDELTDAFGGDAQEAAIYAGMPLEQLDQIRRMPKTWSAPELEINTSYRPDPGNPLVAKLPPGEQEWLANASRQELSDVLGFLYRKLDSDRAASGVLDERVGVARQNVEKADRLRDYAEGVIRKGGESSLGAPGPMPRGALSQQASEEYAERMAQEALVAENRPAFTGGTVDELTLRQQELSDILAADDMDRQRPGGGMDRERRATFERQLSETNAALSMERPGQLSRWVRKQLGVGKKIKYSGGKKDPGESVPSGGEATREIVDENGELQTVTMEEVRLREGNDTSSTAVRMPLAFRDLDSRAPDSRINRKKLEEIRDLDRRLLEAEQEARDAGSPLASAPADGGLDGKEYLDVQVERDADPRTVAAKERDRAARRFAASGNYVRKPYGQTQYEMIESMANKDFTQAQRMDLVEQLFTDGVSGGTSVLQRLGAQYPGGAAALVYEVMRRHPTLYQRVGFDEMRSIARAIASDIENTTGRVTRFASAAEADAPRINPNANATLVDDTPDAPESLTNDAVLRSQLPSESDIDSAGVPDIGPILGRLRESKRLLDLLVERGGEIDADSTRELLNGLEQRVSARAKQLGVINPMQADSGSGYSGSASLPSGGSFGKPLNPNASVDKPAPPPPVDRTIAPIEPPSVRPLSERSTPIGEPVADGSTMNLTWNDAKRLRAHVATPPLSEDTRADLVRQEVERGVDEDRAKEVVARRLESARPLAAPSVKFTRHDDGSVDVIVTQEYLAQVDGQKFRHTATQTQTFQPNTDITDPEAVIADLGDDGRVEMFSFSKEKEAFDRRREAAELDGTEASRVSEAGEDEALRVTARTPPGQEPGVTDVDLRSPTPGPGRAAAQAEFDAGQARRSGATSHQQSVDAAERAGQQGEGRSDTPAGPEERARRVKNARRAAAGGAAVLVGGAAYLSGTDGGDSASAGEPFGGQVAKKDTKTNSRDPSGGRVRRARAAALLTTANPTYY